MSVRSRLWLVTLVGGVVGLLLWCVLDFVLVRYAPSRMHDFDFGLLLFPVAMTVTSFALLSDEAKSRRIVLAVFAAAGASVLATVLVVTVGIWFHFKIGGQL